MFLEWASIVLTVLLSSYVIIIANRKKEKLSCTSGKMISMTNSMMTSVTIGTIFGILFRNTDLTIPTIISMTAGILIGYLTGKPLSLMAVLEGITAGIMGGMMGAMLGIMLQETYLNILIYFIDVVFVLVTILLIKVIDQEVSKFNKNEKSFQSI
ncbi:hypothetical protein [Bacillus sp. AFS088145]|uniref:hypothetical protein n=1 Tax=Bacillus sp. AFS088145 TaxID=2033514 RepID=UPI000BF50717|nr:hypothetical protein [Bacillus sp. AFS088145]PFH92677.1 hypothetical protein COI44_00365 [Bacillus sp. AFS088145]